MKETYAEYFIYSFDDVSITASSGAGTVGTYENTSLRFDSDSQFAAQAWTFVSTDPQINVRFQETGHGRYMFDRAKQIRTVAGRPVAGSSVGLTAVESLFSPMPFLAPYIVEPATEMIMEAADVSGSTNALRMAWHGSKLRHGPAPWNKPWRDRYQFQYGDQVVVGASAVVPITININQDAHFLIRAITAVRTGAAAVVVTDGANDKKWHNTTNTTGGGVHIDNLAGSANAPNVLPAPRLIERGTGVTFTITDLSASSNTVAITLLGEKLFE